MGEPEHAPGITHRQVSGMNEIGCNLGAGDCRLTLQDLGLAPNLASSSHLPLKIARQNGFDPDLERIRRDIQEEGDRVTHRGLSLLQPPCLRVDAPQLGNTDRPPVTAALTPSGVGLTLHRFHHPRPNSASRDVKMLWAMISLISRCRGIVTLVRPHCQTSWRPPCLMSLGCALNAPLDLNLLHLAAL